MGNIEKGKKLVGILAILIIAISILVMITTIFSGTFKVSSVVRLALTGLIMFFVYSGKNWARILIVVLSLISGIFGLLVGVISLALEPLIALGLIVMSVTYIVTAVMLLANKDIKAYYNSCKF